MTDDLDDPIAQHANAPKSAKKTASKIQRFKSSGDAYLNPSRWWFASSAFPMIAGTLGPVASAFSICALVRPWRQSLPDGDRLRIDQAEWIRDPTWLLVVNALQLAVAIMSNMFLLLNMARRVRFTIAQPITVIGWYISAICQISLAATAGGPLEKTDDQVWSQAFYYGVYAAILYALVSTLMLVTIYGAWKGHYDKDFNLTSSQRTLMLQTIMVLFYLLVGAVVFSHVEGWSYLDAVYWADVTLFTVGFGDFAMETTLGRALLFPYALIGVISLGLVIGSIRSLALERGSRKLDARFVEKKRRQKLKKLELEGGGRMLKPIHGAEKRMNLQDTTGNFLTEYERRGQEFVLMRQIQAEANRRQRWVALSISLSIWLLLWLLGAYVFLECERGYQEPAWTYYDAFYFCFVSLTTIGYGDRIPKSNGGRSFFVFWSLLALPTMTVLISNAGDTVVKVIRDSTLTLGNITILPGDRGFKTDFTGVLHKLSCGLLFKANVKTTPPGFLGAADPTLDTDTESGGDHACTPLGQPEMSEQGGFQEKSTQGKNKQGPILYAGSRPVSSQSHTPGSHSNKSHDIPSGHLLERGMARRPGILHRTSSMHTIPSRLPTTRAGYHLALIDEIARVTRHVKECRHKKYCFAEWAWFLALMGEDEGNADTHRAIHLHDTASERTHLTDNDQQKVKWSWVGKRSPLMGGQDETEWVLERLTLKLAEELESVKREVELGAYGNDREGSLRNYDH